MLLHCHQLLVTGACPNVLQGNKALGDQMVKTRMIIVVRLSLFLSEKQQSKQQQTRTLAIVAA